jgi:hypothetical protein
VDFAELAEQARITERHLGALLARVEQSLGQEGPAEDEGYGTEAAEEIRPPRAENQRIEELFEQAVKDRSKAFELKQELDRLGLFKEYEDRFLDLFKKPSEE